MDALGRALGRGPGPLAGQPGPPGRGPGPGGRLDARTGASLLPAGTERAQGRAPTGARGCDSAAPPRGATAPCSDPQTPSPELSPQAGSTRHVTKGRYKVSASGTAATGQVEHMLRQVTPGRYDAYEALLRALATPSSGQVWMLLWHGQAGSPDAQYGNMEVDGLRLRPVRHLRPGAVRQRLEPLVRGGRRPRRGPHPLPRPLRPLAQPARPGRRRRHPLARPAPHRHRPGAPARGPAPAVGARPSRSRSSTPCSRRTPTAPPPSARCAAPGCSRRSGAPYLAIGLDVYDTSPPAVDSVRAMMQQSIGAVPDGLPVSTVAMSDEYDPVAMWMRAERPPVLRP